MINKLKDELRPLSYWTILLIAFLVQSFFIFGVDLINNGLLKVISTLTPFVILLLSSLFSTSTKEKLAHFKYKNPLPGSRAFSKLSDDDRIDVKKIREQIGAFPRKPKEQNKAWYKLFQQVKNYPEIIASHKKYLLFRDLSFFHSLFLFTWVVFFAFNRIIGSDLEVGRSLLITAVLYVLMAIAANNTASRFVQNVLALISSR